MQFWGTLASITIVIHYVIDQTWRKTSVLWRFLDLAQSPINHQNLKPERNSTDSKLNSLLLPNYFACMRYDYNPYYAMHFIQLQMLYRYYLNANVLFTYWASASSSSAAARSASEEAVIPAIFRRWKISAMQVEPHPRHVHGLTRYGCVDYE